MEALLRIGERRVEQPGLTIYKPDGAVADGSIIIADDASGED